MSPRLSFVWRRFERLRVLGVMAPQVVKEFLQCRIAPLQRHSHPLWTFTGHQDCMRLQEGDLAPEMLRKVLRVLTGDPSSRSVRHGGALLYLCSGRAEFVRHMPRENGGCAQLASWAPARIQLPWLLPPSSTLILP